MRPERMREMSKVHFGRGFYSPCGNLGATPKLTMDHRMVTCKSCLAYIRRHGLEARGRFEEVPTFEVVRERRQLVFRCPCCGRVIRHGGGLAVGEGDGHRTSHCGCWERGYFIREERTRDDAAENQRGE